MSERPDQLDDILLDLARRVEFPPTPDLVTPVHAALATAESVHRARSMQRRTNVRWVWLGVVIALLVVIGVAAIPRARHAVADWLGLPGLHIVIEHGNARPTATPQGSGGFAPHSCSANRCRWPISRAKLASRCVCQPDRRSDSRTAPGCARWRRAR